MTIENFLKLPDGSIRIFDEDSGEYWLVIKPLCAALQIDYTRQLKNIHNHGLFTKTLSYERTTAADGKKRKMVCVSERSAYAWLFNIKSKSPLFLSFQLKLYDILYEQFSTHKPILNMN